MNSVTVTQSSSHSKGHSPLVSIVLPAYNEAKNVPVIHEAIRSALSHTDVSIEIIFVDDGSEDDTAATVSVLQEKDEDVRLIRLVRNFGHQAALMAGISAAYGNAVITMDCDLQHPPRYLPAMIENWISGYTIVQMVRSDTLGVPWTKKILSNLFYKVINAVSVSPVRPGVADFQLLDRLVVDELLRLRDQRPFIRGMVGWFGGKVKTIEFIADERHAGIPSYNFHERLSLAGQAFTMLSRKPLRLGLYFGFSAAFLCLLYLVYALIQYFRGISGPGWPSIIISILFIGAVQLIVLGVIGEYICQIYERSRNIPTFVAYPEKKDKLKPKQSDHKES